MKEGKLYNEVYCISTEIDSRQYDDALLAILYKYKGKMDSFTLSCLECFGKLLQDDS